MDARAFRPEEFVIRHEPYYEPVGDEIALFEAAYRNQLPLLLKGRTGCGKTRLVEHVSWRLQRPLITVSCHSQSLTDDPEMVTAVNELSGSVL